MDLLKWFTENKDPRILIPVIPAIVALALTDPNMRALGFTATFLLAIIVGYRIHKKPWKVPTHVDEEDKSEAKEPSTTPIHQNSPIIGSVKGNVTINYKDSPPIGTVNQKD